MSAHMLIRAATVEDAPALCALERAAESAPHWPVKLYETTLGAERYIVFVAESAERMVGFAVASFAVDEVEIESIVVDAQARRQGIGRALLEAVVVWAEGRGSAQIFLEVRESNVAACGLYAAMQFEQVGTREGYYSVPIETAVVMRRELKAGERVESADVAER